jgi:hypothetical protein
MMPPHPDATLIEVGKQFDAARAAANALAPEQHRTFLEYERVAADRGLLPGPSKASDKIMIEVGYRKATQAFSKQLSRACALMRAIHRHKAATTLEGIAVKLAAVVFDQSDFAVDASTWTTDVAEEQLLKLSQQVSKLAGKQDDRASHIPALIKARQDAHAAWLAVDPDGRGDIPEWDAYEEAENVFFRYPCQTLEDVRHKSRAILYDEGLIDSMLNCSLGGDHVSTILLRSFVGEGATS